MAYDEPQAEVFRSMLSGMPGIKEKRMFGGLCFMLNGNMLCGVHKDGGMVRVGKERYEATLKLEGLSPLSFTGRPMGGMCDVDITILHTSSESLHSALELAIEFVSELPSK